MALEAWGNATFGRATWGGLAGLPPIVVSVYPQANTVVDKVENIYFVLDNQGETFLERLIRVWVDSILVFNGGSGEFVEGWKKSSIVVSGDLMTTFLTPDRVARWRSGEDVTVRVVAVNLVGQLDATCKFHTTSKPYTRGTKNFLLQAIRGIDEVNR